ncbi:minichromosome maintenance 2 [Gigaspora rosea]|uniref:DNA replication licensing factor MCM2 n=1 Tax=Gigaspora rosea TaxID=44941 RepID=A0A397UN04_9GLOM|nr:minichromosome maintenance 2 [Gigaspora rosea]
MAERKRAREVSPDPASTPPSETPPLLSPPRAGYQENNDSEDYGFLEEEEIIKDDASEEETDSEGENLFDGEIMERDYRSNPLLDAYDTEDIDDDFHEPMSFEARRRTEMVMDQLGMGAQGGQLYEDAFTRPRNRSRRRRRVHNELQEMETKLVVEEEYMNLKEISAIKASSITEWIKISAVRSGIYQQFSNFLRTYVENGKSIYGPRIEELTKDQLQSLKVNYNHLKKSKEILAFFLKESPSEMLNIFDESAYDFIVEIHRGYKKLGKEVRVRITDFPVIHNIRELRQTHLNSLIRVSGVITRRTGVFPQLKYVKYNCVKCGGLLGPYTQDIQNEIKLNHCIHCQSKGPFILNTEQTVYSDYQKITLQESPGTVPAGRLPRHREVILLGELIDSAKPGEEIEVTGVYRNNFDVSLNIKNGFPVFATVIEANYISKKEDLFASYQLTEDDKRIIQDLAADDKISKKIFRSIAPSIFGHDDIKRAIALSLFGGVPKNIQDKHRLRGDINILMLGDPGTAKSQFLKYVEKTAHRAVFTTGQGASAVGLTASVRKDPITREWTLEAGALVLADKGICLIDEFDKMNDADRTSIHEAMEQQTISISKAGINASLNARCAVIAAANPIRGRYNTSIPFSQNVDLTEPILSRFDVLCVVKDTVDPITDETLANFVVDSHIRSHPSEQNNLDNLSPQDPNIIPQELLRKYIIYAKQITPHLTHLDEAMISDLYSNLRKEAQTGGIPITVRYLESMLRLAEAHARMHLRDQTNSNDLDVAIDIVLQSFFSSQKFSIASKLKKCFAQYINKAKDQQELLLHVLNSLVREKLRIHRANIANARDPNIHISVSEFRTQAENHNIHHIDQFLRSEEFTRHFLFDQEQNVIIKPI